MCWLNDFILSYYNTSGWISTNHNPPRVFNIPYVSDIIHERINKHHNKLQAHPNPLLEPLLQPIKSRRLKRCWSLDLQGTWGDIARWIPYKVIVIRTWHRSVLCTRCPTRCRTRHFFNNCTTNEDITTKFEADLPHCVRNVKEKKRTPVQISLQYLDWC